MVMRPTRDPLLHGIADGYYVACLDEEGLELPARLHQGTLLVQGERTAASIRIRRVTADHWHGLRIRSREVSGQHPRIVTLFRVENDREHARRVGDDPSAHAGSGGPSVGPSGTSRA